MKNKFVKKFSVLRRKVRKKLTLVSVHLVLLYHLYFQKSTEIGTLLFLQSLHSCLLAQNNSTLLHPELPTPCKKILVLSVSDCRNRHGRYCWIRLRKISYCFPPVLFPGVSVQFLHCNRRLRSKNHIIQNQRRIFDDRPKIECYHNDLYISTDSNDRHMIEICGIPGKITIIITYIFC